METTQHSLTVIIMQAQKGDSAAMQALYQQYSKAMFSTCTRMMGTKEDAEDVLQEAFIMTFKNLHQLKEAAQFGGWLKRIVVNECIRHCKKKIATSGWEEYGEQHEQPMDDSIHWWEQVGMEQIHTQIKTLPDGCRQIFTLYAVENYSHRDIAESLGVSESTSKSQYHRAKQLLRERILLVVSGKS
ncbi:RNA polymerase sigma factor [Parasediminibacterium sp. JCM 36343]|uniref:RNA polymerase sigma factor n=1 Tax=Parasediminibacterium sp. JCM 36343 TaxID=3374279 RepID=UPI0039780F32